MEERRRDAANSPAALSSADSEPASTRRRAGALKRKANSLAASSSSATPSKRTTREKSNLISYPSIIHNGPLTRARQGAPSNLGFGHGSAGAKLEELGLLNEKVKLEELEQLNKANEEWEALEGKIKAEFEAIRSRDSNAHLVPNHCGWFSWTKIHPLEERTLPSFFNGKLPTRTPDVYMGIRNWIMKKFHANPNAQIELKDLSEFEAGDLEARQEIMEFLDYWGLINFHPFPPADSSVASADGDEAAKKDSVLEKLYHFEAIESRPPVVLKPNLTTPTLPSGFLPESTISEDLVRPEGPSVEYHCNSCSADCSRKRYHCQKQADFDLCTDCFNNGKFGSDMSSSDFILMEPAEAPGLSGGKWTDQETLLLLEALELYKENWNEIAEHVATKTKAQCILHFVQMPIEDIFLDCDDDTGTNSKETAGTAATTEEISGPKDVPETTESKASSKEGPTQASPMEQETSKPQEGTEVEIVSEKLNPEDADEVKVSDKRNENSALNALKEAFEAVGYGFIPESPLAFTDVGNPVMALAGFLARLVAPDVATALARSSLKSLSSNSPGLQLATRHCFLLEDPPDDKKEPAENESDVKEMADANSGKDENQEERSSKEDKSTTILDHKSSLSNHDDQNTDVSGPEEKLTSASPNRQSTEKKEPETAATDKDIKNSNLNESSNPESLKDDEPSATKDSDDLTSQVPPSSVKESEGEENPAGQSSQPKEAVNDVEMPDSLPSEKSDPCEAAVSKSIEEQSEPKESLENTNVVCDSLPKDENQHQQPVKSNSPRDPLQHTEAPKEADTVSDSQASEKNVPQQPVTPLLVNENGGSTGEDQIKEGKKDCSDATKNKDDHNIDKIKRAAITALSAAAVKAKLLADQEEDQIRQLTTSLIEKQLHKLETKLAFFNEMDSVMMRVKEQLDRSRQRLYHERHQIIAARLGLPASSRAMPPSIPANRIATNFANAVARPPMNMIVPRPPISRPMAPMAPMPNNPFSSTTVAGSALRPTSQDNLSSVGTK